MSSLGSSWTTRTRLRAASSRATSPVPGRDVEDERAGQRVHLGDHRAAPSRVLSEREDGAHPLVLGRDPREERSGVARAIGHHVRRPPRSPATRRRTRSRDRARRHRDCRSASRNFPVRTSTPVMPIACARQHVVHDVVAHHRARVMRARRAARAPRRSRPEQASRRSWLGHRRLPPARRCTRRRPAPVRRSVRQNMLRCMPTSAAPSISSPKMRLIVLVGEVVGGAADHDDVRRLVRARRARSPRGPRAHHRRTAGTRARRGARRGDALRSRRRR